MILGSGGTDEPLLRDEEEAGEWRAPPTLHDIEHQVTDECDVDRLLAEQSTTVIKYIQKKGVAWVGDFQEQDGVVFPAFEKDTLLTLGSDSRHIDYEREWRARLRCLSKTSSLPKNGWTNEVDVEAFVVTVKGPANPGKHGLLQPMLRRYQTKRCSFAVFALPAVQAVIKYKWNDFARRLLLFELFWFLLWLASFNCFVICFQDEDLSSSLADLLRERRGRITVAAEMMALVGMLPFLFLDLATLPAYGLRGWLDLWTACNMTTYLIQIAATVLHLGRVYIHTEWLTALLAAECILLVFRLQYFTQVFRGSRFAFLDIIKDVWGEVRPYFYFMLIIMWGFGLAFLIVYRREQKDHEEYNHPFTAWLSMFEHQYGDLELQPLAKDSKAAVVLGVLYTTIQGTIIINLILGVVINSLDKVMEHQGMKMLLSQARIIDELEESLPNWLLRKVATYPAYLHCLRINPDRLDSVEEDALWTRLGQDDPKLLEGRGLPPTPPAERQGSPEEGEEDGGDKKPSSSKKGGSNGGGQGGGEEGGGKGGGKLEAQVSAMQAQLEEQGRLLRQLCTKLSAEGPSEE